MDTKVTRLGVAMPKNGQDFPRDSFAGVFFAQNGNG